MADTVQKEILHQNNLIDVLKIPFVKYVITGQAAAPHSHSHSYDNDHSLYGNLKSILMSDTGLFPHLRMGLAGFGLGAIAGFYLKGKTFNQYKWMRDLLDYQFYKSQAIQFRIILTPAIWTAGIFTSFSIWMKEIYDCVFDEHLPKHCWSYNRVYWGSTYMFLAGLLVHPSFAPYLGSVSGMLLSMYWLFMNNHFNSFPTNEASYIQLPISKEREEKAKKDMHYYLMGKEVSLLKHDYRFI